MKGAFRFSIKQLLLWTAGLAVAIALGRFFLQNASSSWASLAFWATATVLTLALVVAVNRSGAKRAWWLGFAICGWSYFLLVTCHLASPPYGIPTMIDQENLITTRISNSVYLAYYPPPSLPRVGAPPRPANFVAMDDFVRVAHLLWGLIVAFCGGWISVVLHLTRRRDLEEDGR